jgi:hypothetical protein
VSRKDRSQDLSKERTRSTIGRRRRIRLWQPDGGQARERDGAYWSFLVGFANAVGPITDTPNVKARSPLLTET